MPSIAANVERKISFYIDHQCPQCGAPATLLETDRLFQCEYCRVKSYLGERGYLRYLLPHSAPADQDLIYFPYWRFKGMIFQCLPNEGVQSRYADISLQGTESNVFPISVGLRSQALKLRFVSPETPGQFINAALSFPKAAALFKARFHGTFIKEAVCEALIGDSISLIYAPFYLKDRLYDAILNQPLPTGIPTDFDIAPLTGKHPGATIQFIPALCPECGWDLDGRRDSLALTCANCRTLWQADQGQLKQVTVSHLKDEYNPSIYLPFWRIKAKVSGLDLRSYADLSRLANLPVVLRPEWEEIPFFFWGPAFKVRPESYLRLFGQFTAAQPLEPLDPGLPSSPVFPVNMPIKESIESLMITIAYITKPLRGFVENVHQMKVTPESFRLAYLPFTENPNEYVQSRLNLAINKNQLIMAKNL